MKALLGTTGRHLRRRWARLDGLAILTLPRDPYAETPGPSQVLSLAGRTHYRPSVVVQDEFLRTTLGGAYAAATGFDGLTLVDGVLTADPDDDGLLLHSAALPRDQWAEATIPALDPAGATVTVGVAVRASSAFTGYVAEVVADASAPTLTRLVKYTAGTPETLDETPDPWAPGDVLRCVAEWSRLRVYRSGILVLEVVDPDSPILTGGQAGLRIAPNGAAVGTLTAFLAGAARQESVGLLADRGDATLSLGLLEPTATPASFSLSVINCAPVGGADRFAALLRHGLNDGAGTYDWPRADVRLLTVVAGGSAPLPVAVGRIQALEGMTETVVQVACQGPDATLEPLVEPGRVTYLPGDDPLLTAAPVPEDPCGADAPPTVVPGSPPPEPPPLPEPAPGPEPSDDQPVVSLAGVYLVNVIGPSDLPESENTVFPVEDAEYLAALGTGLELPTTGNGGAVPFEIATLSIQRGSTSWHYNFDSSGQLNVKTQAVVYRNPATLPGTRMRVAVRGPASITCDVGAQGADWGLGINNPGGILASSYGPTGQFQGLTTQGIEIGDPLANAGFSPGTLDGAPKVVRYPTPSSLAELEAIRQHGDERPPIVAVLDAVPSPSAEGPLGHSGCSGPTEFPDWQLYDIDIEDAHLIGIEWGVTEVEDPVTHEITLEPVDADAPALIPGGDYPPNAWGSSARYAQLFIVRIWTPEE